MRSILKKLIHRMPPFRSLYAKLDDLKRRCSKLEKENRKLKKDLKEEKTVRQKEVEYFYLRGLDPKRYEEYVRGWYMTRLGQWPDLEHPKTFNEKIQWLKLYDATPLKARLSDKYLVRDWVAEQIGAQYLVPLLGVYDRFDDIDFDELPDRFVIKTNHAYNTNRVVTDKAAFNREEARKFFNEKLSINFAFWAGLELQYRDIEPRLMIEEYLENQNGNLDDYKCLCFDGTVQYIMYMTDRRKGLKQVIFDREWNRMPFTHSYPLYEGEVEKPDNLAEMIMLAETLSSGFPHVRVDFYRMNDGRIKFSEMTFTTASGGRAWDPPEYDRILGDLIPLPTDEARK